MVDVGGVVYFWSITHWHQHVAFVRHAGVNAVPQQQGHQRHTKRNNRLHHTFKNVAVAV